MTGVGGTEEGRLVRQAVLRAKQGDAEGIHFLYVRFYDDVLRYVNSLVRDYHEAEDITHNVFAKLMTALPKYEPREAGAPPTPLPSAAIKGRRKVWLNGAMTEATLYERERLGLGATVTGPAIVEQFDATTVVPISWNGQVDGLGNLILHKA